MHHFNQFDSDPWMGSLDDQFTTMSESSQTKLVESSNNFMKSQFMAHMSKPGDSIY